MVAPVIPATLVADAGELLESRGGSGYSEPRLSHCTLVWATRLKLHLKKKVASSIYFIFFYSVQSLCEHQKVT